MTIAKRAKALRVGIASDRDIAAMKLERSPAVGSRKDFIDLYQLCHAGLDLERVFELFDAKYATERTERYTAAESRW